MEQTMYMCPLCKDEKIPLIKAGLSRHYCTICDRAFSNKEIVGWEMNRIDFVEYWRERKDAIRTEVSYPLIEDITKKDVDIQMENMVQESTDNLLHEIIMMRIFNKKSKKAEKQVIKDEIDKIFDVILGKD
jgi:hypothetical protein